MKEEDETASVNKSRIPIYISAAIVVVTVAAYFLIPGVKEFFNEAWEVLTSNDEEKIQNWVSQLGWVGPLVLVLSMVLQIVILVIPSFILMIVSILAYGPIWGSLIVFASIFTAASVAYMIGRSLGPVIAKKLIGEKSENKVSGFIEDYGFWAVIITRLNPLLSNDAVSLVAGILKMDYWRFIGATLVGIAPLTIFIAILGETADNIKTGFLWVSVISLILFLGYVWWDKKKK